MEEGNGRELTLSFIPRKIEWKRKVKKKKKSFFAEKNRVSLLEKK